MNQSKQESVGWSVGRSVGRSSRPASQPASQSVNQSIISHTKHVPICHLKNSPSKSPYKACQNHTRHATSNSTHMKTFRPIKTICTNIEYRCFVTLYLLTECSTTLIFSSWFIHILFMIDHEKGSGRPKKAVFYFWNTWPHAFPSSMCVCALQKTKLETHHGNSTDIEL